MPMNVVQQLMGHSKAETTLADMVRAYTRLLVEEALEVEPEDDADA